MTVTTREEIRVGEMVIRFVLEGDESGGSVAVFEFDVPAGAKVAQPTATTATTRRSTGSWERRPGRSKAFRRRRPRRCALHPRGAIHHFDNKHDADAKALAIVTPGILGPDFFREVAAVLDASSRRATRCRGAGRGHAPPRSPRRLLRPSFRVS